MLVLKRNKGKTKIPFSKHGEKNLAYNHMLKLVHGGVWLVKPSKLQKMRIRLHARLLFSTLKNCVEMILVRIAAYYFASVCTLNSGSK